MQCYWRHLGRPPNWEGHKCPCSHHALLKRNHKESAPEDRASVRDSSTGSKHTRWVCSECQLFISSFLPFLKGSVWIYLGKYSMFALHRSGCLSGSSENCPPAVSACESWCGGSGGSNLPAPAAVRMKAESGGNSSTSYCCRCADLEDGMGLTTTAEIPFVSQPVRRAYSLGM